MTGVQTCALPILRTGLSEDVFWPIMRRFHRSSRAVLAATPSLEAELRERGIEQVRPWGRGVDHWLFRPTGELHEAIASLPRPILLNVGRVAPEKNLEAFLDESLPGSKVIVGDGPDLERLKVLYPEVHFMGALAGEELAAAYRTADCFVFPSLTDTFGLVMIEALSSGVPVASFPVQGPIDILGPSGRGAHLEMPAKVGVCDENLDRAVLKALTLDRSAAAVFGQRFSWERATDQFVATIADIYSEAIGLSDLKFVTT